MRSKYKKVLIIITVLLIMCCAIGTNYLFYEKSLGSEMFVEADGELSINYLNNNKIKKDGTYEFSVTNNSDKDFYYEIAMEKRKNFNPDTKINVTSNEANLVLNNIELDNNNLTIVGNILIKSKSTQTFVVTIENLNKMRFELTINKNNDTEEYFYATIIKNNETKKEPTTKVGEEIATTDEGLIEEIDDLGITHYFRGNVPNNYVSFADQTWRIVRINGDGTVRLILDSVTNELTNYHETVEGYEDLEKTAIYEYLTLYYNNNLKSYDQLILSTKFCGENGNTKEGNNKTYNTYTRIITNKIPTMSCLGDKINSKIGLITADEIVFAGASPYHENKSYYLYNEEIENNWWTSSLAEMKNNSFYPFSINKEGKLINSSSGTQYQDVRPVINIIKKATVTGTGTIDNPYIINY